jgi:hypothetical protein
MLDEDGKRRARMQTPQDLEHKLVEPTMGHLSERDPLKEE